MKKIVFTVTNDLNFDQRMIRICHSLATAGYAVLLVGRKQKNSLPLTQQAFQQKRLTCFFEKGKWFYVEYNIRLFFYLLFKKMDAICAIDLDTILPCLFFSKMKGIKRIYDAHELFCEMKEIVSRPAIYKLWKRIEKNAVPQFKNGYTVNEPIAIEFNKLYGVDYGVIQNFAVYQTEENKPKKKSFLLYQGAVNEGRSFETLIPAMQFISIPLHIYGDGNFLSQAKELVKKYQLENKVFFKGKAEPQELKKITKEALIGFTLFENNGLSNYLSLANRFCDYIHAGTPQICVNFPVYAAINKKYEVAVLINNNEQKTIADAVNNLIDDAVLYEQLVSNCQIAAKELNWQNEEKKLVNFYKNLIG